MRGRSYGRGIGRRRHLLLLAAGIAAPGCGGGEPSAGQVRADQLESAAHAAGLDDDVVEVLRRAALAVDATYHVAYDVAGPGGTTTRVEVDQAPPRRRVATTAADGTVDATITDGELTTSCRLAPPAPWRCDDLGRPGVDAAIDPAAIDALADALVAGAATYELAVEDRTILGDAATCLVTTSRVDGTTAELCLAADGAVLVVATPTATIRAVEHAATVDPGVFDRPA